MTDTSGTPTSRTLVDVNTLRCLYRDRDALLATAKLGVGRVRELLDVLKDGEWPVDRLIHDLDDWQTNTLVDLIEPLEGEA